MASCNFEKMKSANDVKSKLRHCDSEMRKQDEHQNWHINKNMTSENMQISNRDYKTTCNLYDNKLKELDSKDGANKRKDRVTAVGIEIPCPKDLPNDKESEWLIKANNEICSLYGSENVLQSYFHFDEKHSYINAETKEQCTSRSHLHSYLIPCVDEKLNAKSFTSRSNMIKLNNAIQEMTARDYGIAFMDGTKKKSKKTVEQLYQESDVEALKLDLEAQYQDKVNKLALDKQEWLKTQNTSLERHYKAKEEELKREYQKKQKELDSLIASYEARIANLDDEVSNRVNKAVKRRNGANTSLQEQSCNKPARQLPNIDF